MVVHGFAAKMTRIGGRSVLILLFVRFVQTSVVADVEEDFIARYRRDVEHIGHSNIYHDYDMLNHINLFLWKKKEIDKRQFLVFFLNIRPGVIHSGRYEGVDIHTRPFGHEESEQICLTTKYILK